MDQALEHTLQVKLCLHTSKVLKAEESRREHTRECNATIRDSKKWITALSGYLEDEIDDRLYDTLPTQEVDELLGKTSSLFDEDGEE